MEKLEGSSTTCRELCYMGRTERLLREGSNVLPLAKMAEKVRYLPEGDQGKLKSLRLHEVTQRRKLIKEEDKWI